ncbi:MAG: hypothetical protein ACKV2Q_26900 [Planctomycetaceae bacterium]
MLSIFHALLALWKGLPLLGKIVVGIGGVYVAHKVYEAAANWMNTYLDENHPDIEFRLNADIVRWATELVKAVITTAMANDKTGTLKHNLQHMAEKAAIDLVAGIIGEQFDEAFGRQGSALECEIIAHGVHYALVNA